MKTPPRLFTPLLVGIGIFLSSSDANAALFDRAEVSRVHNQVTLIEGRGSRRPAEVLDVVTGDTAVQTGLESRAELRFPDSTLARLASNTFFSFRSGTRQMNLSTGAILFQVPPGSGGVEIHAAAITAAITGTTGFVERIGNVFKLIVLEGEVRVYLRDKVGESMIVPGGKMLIAPLNSTSVRGWQLVDVDVEKLVNSSKLLSSKYFGPLPPQASDDINRVASDQESRLERGRLSPTNLVINGGVTQVLLVDRATRNRLDTRPNPGSIGGIATGPRPVAPPDPLAAAPPIPQPLPTPNANPPPTAIPNLIARLDPYVISPATAIATRRRGTPTITTNDVSNTGGIFRGNAIDGSATQFVSGSSSPFDLRSDFDNRFGRNSDGEFAPNGVAVFRFNSIRIIGPPSLDTAGGPVDLALVAANLSTTNPGIVSGGPGGNWELSGLRSLFLGTTGSSIVLNNPMSFSASGDLFRYLHLYSRGAGSDTTLGTITYLVGDLYIDSERDVILNVRADVVVRRLVLNAMRDLRVQGRTSASFTQLTAVNLLEISGEMRSQRFFGFARDAMVHGSLIADYVNFQLTGDFLSGGPGTKVSTEQFLLTAANFELNGDRGAGTTFDLARLTRLELNVQRLTLGSDFTLPAGVTVVMNLGYIDAPLRGLFGFDSIVTTGSNDNRLGDLSVRSFTSASGLVVARDVQASNLAIGGMLSIGRELRPSSADPSFLHTVLANTIGIASGINFTGREGTRTAAAGDGFSLQLLASEIAFTNGSGFGIKGANLDGGSATSFGTGASGGTLQIGNNSSPIAGNVTLGEPISATTGRNMNAATFGGNGGSVNVVANGTITASSRLETSSNSGNRRSARGGNVRLTSNRLSGTAIQVTGTAQIASLLAAGAPGPGGEVVFRSAGGDVDISGSVTADRGAVEIENTGSNGRITLANATISADVVRARAFGENGVLTIGGGTISADNILKLYADGSNGTVLFVSNVSLNGNSTKIITGNTVTIAPSVVVNIGGPSPAQVYTNNANYTGFGGNNSSTGTFVGAGATTQSRAAAPGY